MENYPILNDFIDNKPVHSTTIAEKEYQVDIKAKKKFARMMRNAGLITFAFFLILGCIINKSISFNVPFPAMLLIIIMLLYSFSATKDTYDLVNTDFLFYDDSIIIFKEKVINEVSNIIQMQRIYHKDVKNITYNKVDNKLSFSGKVEAIDYTTDVNGDLDEVTSYNTFNKNFAIYFNDDKGPNLVTDIEKNSELKVEII